MRDLQWNEKQDDNCHFESCASSESRLERYKLPEAKKSAEMVKVNRHRQIAMSRKGSRKLVSSYRLHSLVTSCLECSLNVSRILRDTPISMSVGIAPASGSLHPKASIITVNVNDQVAATDLLFPKLSQQWMRKERLR